MIIHLKKYFLLYTILPLLAMTLAASYYRFMVNYDYLVSYEGYCDEFSESCFLYCESEECSEPFYYSIIEVSASSLKKTCGTEVNILNCDAASTCQTSDSSCTVTYCDALIDSNCENVQSTNETLKLSTS